MPIATFMARIAEGRIPRVPGTAVFLTRTERDAPPVMVWHLKHNRALHERLFVLTVVIEAVPWIEDATRLNFDEIAPRFWRATARYGFMERPDIPALLRTARAGGCGVDLSDVTYYVGHETVVPSDSDKGLPRWLEALFAAHAAQLRPCQRLLQATARRGRRDWPGNRNLRARRVLHGDAGGFIRNSKNGSVSASRMLGLGSA